jgi:hypothetical protein
MTLLASSSKTRITVPGCSTRSGMILAKLRGTRILTEGNSRFYTQPEVGRWVAPSECANGSFRVFQYGSFRMYQYSSFRMYVDCHVTKSKVQAGAVTTTLPSYQLIHHLLRYSTAILAIITTIKSLNAACTLTFYF